MRSSCSRRSKRETLWRCFFWRFFFAAHASISTEPMTRVTRYAGIFETENRGQPVARYKGRMRPKTIERTFPHVVEIAVPPGGLGAPLDAMHYFHGASGIQALLGRGRREDTT